MSAIDQANKAKAVLEAPGFNEAFKATREQIIRGIEACPLADAQKAEDLRRCLKLLNDVRMNLETAVNGGKLEAFRIEQQEKRRSNPFRKYL